MSGEEGAPCGHAVMVRGCGGCDPSAIEFVLTDDGMLRGFDADLDLAPDPYDRVVWVQGHRHSEPVCAWPDCQTYLTRAQMTEAPEAP